MSAAAARVLARATRPAARAVPWLPPIVAGGALVVLAALTRGTAEAGTMPALACAAVAAACVFALHDRGEALLAAVPTGPMRRRQHRLSIVVVVAAPAWLLLQAVMPGVTGLGILPVLALVTAGAAAAVWTPSTGVGGAPALPLLWVGADAVVSGALEPAGEMLGWWRTEPSRVLVSALLVLLAGRHR
jgi:hypothetical protein